VKCICSARIAPHLCSLSFFKSHTWTTHFSAGMLFILSISNYCSLLSITTYASFVSLILKAVGFIVIMLLKWWGGFRRYFRVIWPNRAVHSLRFFYDNVFSLQYSACLQAGPSLSTRSFCESILFVHLKVLRGGELRLVRTVGMVGFNNWQDPLWKFVQKMALAQRAPSQVSCSPSSAQTNIIIKQYNLDLKPPCFIRRQGMHALQ